MSLLDPVLLCRALAASACRFEVEAVQTCESTNALLLAKASEGAASGLVVVADRQTAGRGRRGRAWVSSPQESLTFSLLWYFAPEKIGGLSLAVGLAMLRALEKEGARDLALKWPNDLLHVTPAGAGKLAGILVELVNAPANRMAAVIGIGLNLCAPTVPGQQTAGLADCCAAPPERHALLAALLAELARTLDIFTAEGFAALRDEWQARHLWQGRPVRLGENGRFHAEGICRGVDADGALLLETPRGLERFFAGDLSLRPATGSAP